MFPGSYSYNPGVVLDPITMTPMISGSSFTVNPLGVATKPEQKVWQKMFIKDIPTQCTNECLAKLLNEFGEVKNFKRSVNQRGELLSFCYFNFETGEEILRLRRLFKNIRVLDKLLELKISGETETFIKEWGAIQKDEWRKKLLAPGMNEAKQFATLEDYLERDDAQYRVRIEDKLREINSQVKKYAIQKMREQEKKEHPRQKEREKQRRRQQQQLARNFQQQEDYLLKRQRNKEKQYRKNKQRERSMEKRKAKRLDKQLSLSVEEEQKRIARFLTAERMHAVEIQEAEDIEAILQQNPPLPQEELVTVLQPKRVKVTLGQSQEIRQSRDKKLEMSGQIVLEAEKIQSKKQVRLNKMFEDWNKDEPIQQENREYELKLPELREIESERQRQSLRKKQVADLEKRVPRNKSQLFEYQINWDRLSKSVVLDQNIRPWLQEQSSIYMGSVEQKFVALVEKRLFSQSKPQKIIKVMAGLIDEDAEEFVIKLWRAIILEDLKLKNGLYGGAID